MFPSLGRLERLCRTAVAQCGQIRHVVIVKRWIEPPSAPKGTTPHLKPEHFRYRIEDMCEWHKKKPLKLVMMKDLEGIGSVGDVVKVKRGLARNFLIPNGYATYPTAEAKAEYGKIKAQRGEVAEEGSWTALRMMRTLSYMHLPVPMNVTPEWTLNAGHLRVALRLVGIEIPQENIYLSSVPVTGPGPIEFGVTVNGKDIVRVQGTVYHQTPAGVKLEEIELPPIFVNVDVALGEIPPDIVYWDQAALQEEGNKSQSDEPS